MKLKKFGVFGIVFTLLIFSSYTLYNQSDKNEILIKLAIEGLKAHHYSPQEINDSFSEEVFTNYLKGMDYGKRYFTQEDMERMGTFRQSIDDQVKAGSYDFFDLSVEIFEQRLQDAKTYCTEILSDPDDLFRLDERPTLIKHAMRLARIHISNP